MSFHPIKKFETFFDFEEDMWEIRGFRGYWILMAPALLVTGCTNTVFLLGRTGSGRTEETMLVPLAHKLPNRHLSPTRYRECTHLDPQTSKHITYHLNASEYCGGGSHVPSDSHYLLDVVLPSKGLM